MDGPQSPFGASLEMWRIALGSQALAAGYGCLCAINGFNKAPQQIQGTRRQGSSIGCVPLHHSSDTWPQPLSIQLTPILTSPLRHLVLNVTRGGSCETINWGSKIYTFARTSQETQCNFTTEPNQLIRSIGLSVPCRQDITSPLEIPVG
jgi:hypothetical protein